MAFNTFAGGLGLLLTAGYLALICVELARYFGSAPYSAPDAPAAVPRVGTRRMVREVLMAVAASRLLIVLVCAAIFAVEKGTLSGFRDTLLWKLRPSDASHYLEIIENGYVAEGDARYHIVFFPFYPMVGRALTFMTGMPAFPAALIASNLALFGSGCAMYRLAKLDGGAEAGRRAMLLLMFNPMAFFFSVPCTESMFMLNTLLSVLFARRRQWARAVLFGAMVANTRILGMATAITIYWEMLNADRERAAAAGLQLSGGAWARRLAVRAAQVLPVAAGLALYMCVNESLFHNPVQFMVFQRENWSQSFGSLANTLRYSLENALTYEDYLYRFGIWLPQAVLLAAVPLLIWRRRRHERPGDMGYALMYHYVAFAPTWLLSGPRYAACNYALYPMLARIPESKRQFAAILLLQCALMAAMIYVGMWNGRAF